MEAILFRDYPVVQTNVMLVAGTLVIAQSPGGSHVRVAGSADPVSMSAQRTPMSTVTARAPVHVEAEPTVEIGASGPSGRRSSRKPLGAAPPAIILCSCSPRSSRRAGALRPLAAQPEIRLAAPSWAHPFGTDDIGRDVLSRIIYGSRISLWVGLLAVGIGTVAGMIIGLLCGYCEGGSICVAAGHGRHPGHPGLVLALAIVSVLKPNTTNAMLAIAMVIIPGNSRIVRGAVLSAKQNRYVEAAQAIGCRHPRIILSHILPNVTAPILIIASIWLGNAILIEATLCFLGVGTQPPKPSWGLMLSSTGRAFMEQAPWLAIFPGLAISLAVLGVQSLRRHAAGRVGSQARG